MTDEVQKIREEVEKRYKYWREKESNSHSIESEIRMSECQHLLLMLNSMQEETVSEDLEKAAKHYLYSNILYDDVYVGNPTDKDCIEMFKAGAEWQKEKDTILPHIHHRDTLDEFAYQCSYDLSNDWAKEAPEWKDVKTACKLGAQWQKEQFEKNRLAACDKQTQEEAEIECNFVTSIIEKEHRKPTFDDAIKYGMKLREEQMMAKAIDGEILEIEDDDCSICSHTHLELCIEPDILEKNGFKNNDKVKVIVVKEY